MTFKLDASDHAIARCIYRHNPNFLINVPVDDLSDGAGPTAGTVLNMILFFTLFICHLFWIQSHWTVFYLIDTMLLDCLREELSHIMLNFTNWKIKIY